METQAAGKKIYNQQEGRYKIPALLYRESLKAILYKAVQ
jgi:hypothetical protein